MLQGSHELQVKVTLADDTDVSAGPGTQLDFDNALDLGGFTLTITGSGQVNINNQVSGGDESFEVISAGTLTGGLTLGGPAKDLFTTDDRAPLPGTSGVVDLAAGKDGENSIQVLFTGVADMPQGTIKKLVADRGFGFIEGEQGDMFFHHSAVQGTTMEALSVGQVVEYEVGHGPKGPRAENVRGVDSAGNP